MEMKLKRKYSIILGLILIFISISDIKQAREANLVMQVSQINPFLHELVMEYDRYFRDQTESKYVPGAAVCIIKDDKIIHMQGYGIRDITTMDSVGINTVFRLGSVSKSIAATFAGMLVEDQLIDWEDPVKMYIPEFKLKSENSTNSLEIKHLLSHTTGLIRHTYTNYIEDGKQLDDMISALDNVSLIGSPGKIYSYQNLAYGLIQPIVESVTGMDYETALTEKMFKPMNMKNASASYEAISENPDVAFPHYYYKGRLKKSGITHKYYNAIAAGGINASIWDMANFMIAITGQKPWLINETTLHDLYTPLVRTHIKYQYFGGWPKMKRSYYGLGFRILEYDTKIVAYHGGYVNGYRAGMAIIPEDNVGICILTNYSGNLANRGIRDFIDLYLNYEGSIRDYENTMVAEYIGPKGLPSRSSHSIPPM